MAYSSIEKIVILVELVRFLFLEVYNTLVSCVFGFTDTRPPMFFTFLFLLLLETIVGSVFSRATETEAIFSFFS